MNDNGTNPHEFELLPPAEAQSLNTRVYNVLRDIAGGCLAQERRNHTLSATALVHEAIVRLDGVQDVHIQDQAHLLNLAAVTMRRVLVDHARARQAAKRGGGWGRITLSEIQTLSGAPDLDVLCVDEALEELATLNVRQARIVELRFFGGFSVEETAAILEVSPRTVELDWRHARAWLLHRLQDDRPATRATSD